MATQVQWRRGTHAQVLAFTGAVGEIVMDTTQNRLSVQDGVTAGGWPVPLMLDLGQDAMNWKTVSGSANAIVLTSQNAPLTAAQVVAGTRVTFKATASITSATPTMLLDAQAAPATVQRNGAALAFSDVQNGLTYIAEFDGVNWQLVGGVLSGNANSAFNDAKAANIASAASIELGNITGNRVDVTGTVTISAATWGGGAQIGAERWVKFTGILQLTYNAVSFQLPTQTNITTAAGDYACFRNLGGGNTECVLYQRASGQALATLSSANVQYFSGSGTWNAPASFSVAMVITGGGGGGGAAGATAAVTSGGGGGGGARTVNFMRSTDMGASQTVTIGGGGGGGSTAAAAGAAGSNTTFGSLITTFGGGGGSAGLGAYGGGGGGGLVSAGGTAGAGGAAGTIGGGAGAPTSQNGGTATTAEGGGGGASGSQGALVYVGGASAYGGAGGAGGASYQSGGPLAGGAGGASLNGTAGTAGASGGGSPGGNGGTPTVNLYGGGGGGGGGTNGTTLGANGGNGGLCGGGGGGGAGTATFGHGGNGGNGFCCVVCW